MRFVFLGTGTSSGVPAIACSCAVCTSTDPRDQRLRTSAALQWTDPSGQDRAVLIDAGPDLRTQALRHRITRCDAVLFTHNHVDHTFGLDEIRRYNAVQKTPIDIYAERHTLNHLHRVYAHIFDRAHNINNSFVADLIEHEVVPDQPIDLWGVRFTPIRLLHGKLPIVGYRVERAGTKGPRDQGIKGTVLDPSVPRSLDPFPLAYCTDVSHLPPEAYPHLQSLGTLVLDALRHRRHPTHLTIDQSIAIAQKLDPMPRRTYFTHLAHEVGHAATSAELPEGIELAYDGLVLEG